VTFVVLLVVLVAVVLLITGPLRRSREGDELAAEQAGSAAEAELRELEAAREAKYREIRDAELDHQTGKLSDADFDAIDRALRAEAITILDQLDAAREQSAEHAEFPDESR
jgi:hypothetical protein